MLVSVVICTYHADNRQNLLDVVASLLNQTYREMEIIIVVDGNKELGEKIAATYNDLSNIQVIASEESVGVSGARDLGIGVARGDIIAFLDDDAIAEERWIEGLVHTYQTHDAMAVGGKVMPIWLQKKPDHLPEELYWLVGLTYDGFDKEGITEVRNTLGPNMSFKREVFAEVGGFNQAFGFARRRICYIQGEEPELALRMKYKLGRGVTYNPELIVYHKVPEWKTKLRILLRRAFYQGYSKALLKRISPHPEPLATEESYLKGLLFKYIPQRVKALFIGTGSAARIKQLLVLFASIFAVGLGFIYGYMRALPSDMTSRQREHKG
jgi:glycosyltransferase involved in cell wall biosynthesis